MNYLSEIASGRFMTLPAPLQIGLGAIAGTATLGGTWFIVGPSPSRNFAMLIVAIGLVCVFLLFLLFRAIVKWNAKRKASPLAQGIAGNAAAAPQGVSEPARRARLDDLRRNFEQGVEKFRAAGKNLYSVPWYVLVGEPGSGKTEAIRHCNVGFPPGLQDQLQGAGGTLNMNWWFTNSAIILDTAGRLMFEEVPPGSTNEWHEFLKLLKQNRPNSPLNGMLLVIPVDTLIKDSADAIEKKATRIAQQFDQIQRNLGVRFPVFVIISKCDLLNGFREFFDDLNDPQLQHQIMGWSNPAPLDERFDPAKVTAHLESVKQRLISRRQNLLLDPVHTEDPQARRVDQVDALYALPDSLTKIAPRLRRYLEMIFVAGEWSPKPLFLRGIYFTSSMTEGAALDAELAEALGVPVDSLPGGAIFRKDRAYFLRDLFLEKVFREKGLVTRASNADKQQRTRRMLVLGFGFLAVIILFAITMWASSQLNKSLGAERAFWDTTSKWDFGKIAIINANRNNAYFGDSSMTVAGSATSLPKLFADRLGNVQNDLYIPFIFKPMTVLSSDVNGQRRVAYRSLYESTVLRPLYTTARSKIPGDTWDPQKGPAALAELMKLEYAAATGKPPGAPDQLHRQVELAPLFALAVSNDDYKLFASDNDGLQKVADWLYTPAARGDTLWPPKILGAGTPASLDSVKAGVDATVAYWQAQTTDNGKALESIKNVRDALLNFRDAETALNVASKGGSIDKLDVYHAYRDVWKAQMDKLRDAAKRASEAWVLASNGKADAESLRKLYEDQKNRIAADAQKTYDALLAITPPVEGARDNDSYRALLGARAKLEDAKKTLLAWNTTPENKKTLDDLSALDAAYFGRTIKGLDKADHRRFEVHQQLYELADKMVVKDDAAVQLAGTMADAFSQVDKEYSDAVNTLKQPLFQGGDQLNQAGALAQFTIDASGRAKKYLLADVVLAGFPKDAPGWNAAITKIAKDAPRDALVRPQVPLATFPAGLDKIFNDQFSPDAAGVVTDRLDAITKLAADKDAATKILDSSDLKSRADAASKTFGVYKEAFIHYWRDTVKEELNFSESYTDFKAFSAKIADATEASAYEQLKAYGDRMVYALTRIGNVDDANAVKLALPAISREECKIALSGWTNLGADPVQVRLAILGKIANDFKDGYTVPSAKNNDGYAARYWNSLPVAALRALVADGQKQIREGIAELAKYEKFPLAPMGDKKDDLSQADILAARKALEKIRGAGTATAAAPPGAGAVSAKPISQGGTINSKAVDDQLDLLRGTNLLSGKQDYFDKLDKFLAGLPLDAKPLSVILTVNKAKLSEVTDTISNAYSYMPISQAGKLLREANLISTSVTDTAPVEYSGGDLTLGFRQTPGGTILQTETFPGPWAVFRLLKSPSVKSVSREGNKWTVEYTITTAEKKAVALWLILEFKQPIPDLKDWPVPPGAGN